MPPIWIERKRTGKNAFVIEPSGKQSKNNGMIHFIDEQNQMAFFFKNKETQIVVLACHFSWLRIKRDACKTECLEMQA